MYLPLNLQKNTKEVFVIHRDNKHDGMMDFNSDDVIRMKIPMKIRHPFSPRGGNLVLVERG